MTHTLPSRRRTPAHSASIRSIQPDTVPDTQPKTQPDNQPAWPHAARAETAPGALPAVPAHWAVFHPLPGAAHLVVGPGGIFTITVQNLNGDWAWVDKRGLLVAGAA